MLLARVLNVLLGLWLVVSAFVWSHSPASKMASVILGILCVAFALMAFVWPVARYLNTVLSIVLYILGFSLAPNENATVWNAFFVASFMFIASLAPPGRTVWPRQMQPA